MLKINLNFANIGVTVRLGFYILAAAMAAVLIGFLLFLYKNFYLTLAQAGDILVLKASLAVEILDTELAEKTKHLNERRERRELFDWQKVRDPFVK